MSEYIAVIKLQGAHALNGNIKGECLHSPFLLAKDERMFALFQKKQGNYIPYLVENINFTGNHCIVKLADINNREEAGSLTGNELFLPEKEAHRFFDITEKIDFYGYLAYNNQELLGKLIELRQFPGQQIFIIENDDRGEILVPFTQDWIVEMNHEKRTIVFSLPEGLLDL